MCYNIIMDTVNKEKLEEAIAQLTKAYQRPTVHEVEKGIRILQLAVNAPTVIQPVRLDQIKVSPAKFFPTYEPWLDEWLANPRKPGDGGMRLKEAVLVAGMPYSGKSHWLQWLTSRYVLQNRDAVYFFGEDLQEDVRDNFLLALRKNPAALQHLWLVDMDGRFSVSDAANMMGPLRQAGANPFLVTFDHLDLMNPSSSHREDWRQAEEIVTDLKFFAKHENVIAITASQRTFDTNQHGMASLYRSKIGKAGNVDVMLMINEVFNGNEYDMSIEKARGRRLLLTHKKLYCDWSKMTIADMSYYGGGK